MYCMALVNSNYSSCVTQLKASTRYFPNNSATQPHITGTSILNHTSVKNPKSCKSEFILISVTVATSWLTNTLLASTLCTSHTITSASKYKYRQSPDFVRTLFLKKCTKVKMYESRATNLYKGDSISIA